ncbi:tail fiber domain-containing protein [Chryseobacterium indologenes]|uniref:tail fiber domain-containing protein n=1 Tax=Chryseobacterium indologenes TaxID=253 RepID=UPI001BCFDB27|nr:tail fiber domain-containing protein [Chryseobacterium indologenes]
MKKATLFFILSSTVLYSQAGNIGINTTAPGSSLTVNGSLAAKYNAITSAAYTMTSSDFHISYNGTANAVFTLPTAISGDGNFKGRMYTIKNNTAFTITVNPAATETINGNASATIGPNQSLQLISTGLTGAASTWELSGSNSAVATNVTASNGLTTVGNDVRLGGTLLQNTAIDYADKALYFRSNVDGFGLTAISNSNPGTNAAALLQFTNNTGSSLNMFLNSSTKTTDGGANASTINSVGGPLTVAGNNNVAQFRLSQLGGGDYLYNNDRKLNFNGDGDITAFGTAGNAVNAYNGLLTLKGNSSIASFSKVTLGSTGLRYYFADDSTVDKSVLDINGYGDIYMKRSDGSGNIISSQYGHLDLSGFNGNTPNAPTQIYLGIDGLKYSYSGFTKTTINGIGDIKTAGDVQGQTLSSISHAYVGNNLSVSGSAYVTGTVTASGTVLTSDMRLKTQVKEIGYGLSTIMALQPKQYELSADTQIKDGKPAVNPALKSQHRLGFLAQNLYKIVPEAVYKPKDDSKEAWGVDYTALVPALTKAIQEQEAEIEQQRNKINKLELEMEGIKKKLGL